MSSPMEQPRYSLLHGDLDGRVWKRVESRSTGGLARRCVILLIALVFTSTTALAQETGPRFEVGGNSDVRVGQKTSLTCNLVVKGFDPPSSYVWVKDGKIIPSQTDKYLSLSSVKRQDAGYYQCGTSDSNSYGQGIRLWVWVPGDRVARPVIFPQGEPVFGRPFSVHCIFLEGYVKSENTVYTWYKDSVEVKGQNGETLLFDSVKEGDEGRYTCTAREGPPQTTSPQSLPADVRPLVPPQVRIKPPGPVVRGVRGENLTLTCEVTRAFPDVPVDGYSWSYLPFPNGPQRPLFGEERTLTLGPLTLEDRGQYVCQARNDQKPQCRDLNLTGHTFVTVDIVYLENLTLTSDLEVSEGDRVSLTCAVKSRPTAQLAWTVRGQEVRHVTDNVDHYVITRAACSDSGSYTCGASNTELPGRDRHATVQLLVHCKPDPTYGTSEVDVSAIFHFPLPDWTPMVVVHPGGHDVISVGQDCSYNVSSAFQSRCLQPWCDSIRHRLSFTLTNVTEEDTGEYVCLEEGPQKRPIYNCSKKLHGKKLMTEKSQTDNSGSSLVALAVCVSLLVLLVGALIAVLIGTKRNCLVQNFCHGENDVRIENLLLKETHWKEEEGGKGKETKGHDFERLYNKGELYIFPSFIPPCEDTMSGTEEGSKEESVPLLQSPVQNPSVEQIESQVNQLRSTIQMSIQKREKDMPSFILHNTRLCKRENVVLVLDKKIGIILMVVNTASNRRELHSAEEAAHHLVEARDTVRRKLQGLVTSGAVQAVLSLPCLTHDEADDLKESLKILQSHPDVELLAGSHDFRGWAERLGTGARQLWQFSSQGDSPDSVYTQVATRFLKLESCMSDSSDPKKSLLLTPAQVEVRDSTARLLHIWGPPGSGKTTLLVHRARQWLAEGKTVILAAGHEFHGIALDEVGKAVRKGLQKEACDRIRICHNFCEIKKAGKGLKSKFPTADVCVIIDILSNTYLLNQLLPEVRSGKLFHIWSTGWEDLYSVSVDLHKKTKKLEWESMQLPDCIRCTDNTVKLLNQLGHGVFLPIPSCSVPRDQDIPALTVVDHCLHPDHVNTVSSCVHCKKEMSAALPSKEQGLWRNSWVALHTGDPNIFLNSEPLQEAEKIFGAPVSYHNTYPPHETAMAGSASLKSTSSSGDPAFDQAQDFNGSEEERRPAVRLFRVVDFKGMEREGVILVHWDYRDIHPKCQSEAERVTRLEEHRHQWIQAASRSTGQVILLLLSPSPARSLLGLPEAAMP